MKSIYNKTFINVLLIFLAGIASLIIKIKHPNDDPIMSIQHAATALKHEIKGDKGKKCILLGKQEGWKFPRYKVTTDSMVADSFLTKMLPDSIAPWEILKRDSFLLIETSPNVRVYAEYGTYTLTKNGAKKFTGASDNKYLKRRFK
ncbi:hypothetical protein [Mangrovibacterium sp.]|uniref:hypothetical protein n=1 Tax=Mangrovibacterium sp. TaxID=1961364 RepID=UPI0035639829